MSAMKRPAGDMTPSNYESPSKIKKLDAILRTPLTPLTYNSPRLQTVTCTDSPSINGTCKIELNFNDDGDEEISYKVLQKSETVSTEQNDPVESNTIKQALEERNTQRNELVAKLKNLADKNREYKLKLQNEDASSRENQKILQNSYETQLGERDTLLTTLQDIIKEHEIKIHLLQQQIDGNPSTDQSKATVPTDISKLILQIRQLQQEKSDLLTELTSIRSQIQICKRDHVDTIKTLQDTVGKVDSQKSLSNTMFNINTPTTDTEKHLEKITADNARLQMEVRKYKVRQSSIGFNSENEHIRTLQEENEKFEELLESAEKKVVRAETAVKETQSKCQEEVLQLSKENQKLSRLLRDIKADVTCLQAREPEVMTKIERVEIEVESENLQRVLTESQKENATLETDVKGWKQKHTDVANQITALQQQNYDLIQKLQDNMDEIIEMDEKHDKDIQSLNQLMDTKVYQVENSMKEEMNNLRSKNSYFCSKLSSVNSMFKKVCESHYLLKKQASQFPRVIAVTVESVKKEAVQAIEDMNKMNQELVCKYHKEMKLRKKYHNELVELRGNIRVFCRVRPCIKEDGVTHSSQLIVTFDPYDDGLLFIANKSRSQVFEMDKVFNPSVSQTEVFEEVKCLVTSCVDGYNVCIFAYGQTGSGKTHTMEGPVHDPGINQRALQELFNETKERGSDWEYIITVSVLEIYNENIRDLLNDDGCKLEIKMKADGNGLYVPGLTVLQVTSLNQVNQVFLTGQKNRATAATNLNEHSSRSHALLCVEVTGLNKTTNTRTTGKLNLVDLAGSERVSRSGADGARLKEAQNINKSLSCLGDVINSLRSKQNHVPYRNSKLTYLLQDSLGGDSKTLMIVQVSPAAQNVSESMCTLNFAQRVRMVQLGSASRQVESGDINENALSTPTRSPMSNSPRYNSPKHTTLSNNKTSSNTNKTPLSAKRGLTPRFKPR